MLALALALVGIALPSGSGNASEPVGRRQAATQDLPPDAPDGAGPRGTSGEAGDDVVGYASLMAGAPHGHSASGVSGVGHPTLPAGSFVEVTSLDTGRTIVALVVAPDADGSAVALSPGAAQALGVGDHAAVRVRAVIVSPQDRVALRSGQAASPRLDAPPALITALRRKLPGRQTSTLPAAPLHATRPGPPARPPLSPLPSRGATASFFVQVAALSSGPRAAALAQQLGGRVVPGGKLYRVQLGPFADKAGAQQARDKAARQGYRDAAILHSE